MTIIERVIQPDAGVQWGDVATWLASLGTLLTLAFAVYVLYLQRRDVDFSQASEVVAFADYGAVPLVDNPASPVGVDYRVTVTNHSNKPIMSPSVTMVLRSDEDLRKDPDRMLYLSYRRFMANEVTRKELQKRVLQLRMVDAPSPDSPNQENYSTNILSAGATRARTANLLLSPDAWTAHFRFFDMYWRRWQKDLKTGELVLLTEHNLMARLKSRLKGKH